MNKSTSEERASNLSKIQSIFNVEIQLKMSKRVSLQLRIQKHYHKQTNK